MRHYYYLGDSEYSAMEFVQLIKDKTLDMSRLYILNSETFICNTTYTYSYIIKDDIIYSLRCNVMCNGDNILCYYKDM